MEAQPIPWHIWILLIVSGLVILLIVIKLFFELIYYGDPETWEKLMAWSLKKGWITEEDHYRLIQWPRIPRLK